MGWWLYALLSALFAALTTILAKIGIKDVPADVATAMRTVIILFIAWGLVFYKGLGPAVLAVPGRSLLFIALSGVATGVSWLFYFRALQAGPASQVAAIDKASLAMTIVLALVFLKETLTLKAAAGAGLILAGTALLIL